MKNKNKIKRKSAKAVETKDLGTVPEDDTAVDPVPTTR